MAIKVGGTTVINDNLQIENTAGIDLAPIAATIADTAVDVFVYDTRKDSDGGAWRKRTQGTSWYNETLNTATRGSRKEFPSVAVIVVHSLSTTGKVTIYDGDDPSLPMWMVLNGSSSALDLIPSFSGTSLSCVSAFNGIVMVGNGTYDIDSINFVEDAGYKWSSSSKGKYNGNIEQRADGLGFSGNYGSGIVNRAVNDVAMTVLPNAPIDAATGLPVPTIAVATDGGVSVIKDDGTVSNVTPGGGVVMTSCDFDLDYNLVLGRNSFVLMRSDYPRYLNNQVDSDYAINNRKTSTPSVGEDSTSRSTLRNVVGISSSLVAYDTETLGVGLYSKSNNNLSSMVAKVASDYNTGWMNGDIKLATLSDTDATNVTGSELVTNGTFDTDTSGWQQAYVSVAPTTFSSVNGQLVARRGDQYRFAVQQLTVEVGKTYTVSVDSPTGDNLMVGKDSNSNQYGFIQTGAAGTGSVTFTATQTALYIMPHTYKNQTTDTIFDNISVRLAEEDRSVNGNGLQVFGTVTKTPVATGADLVGYSNFSESGGRYLQQPYNSDLDFGTGDFSAMWWVYRNDTGAGTIFHRSSALVTDTTSSSDAIIQAEFNSSQFQTQVYTNNFGLPSGNNTLTYTGVPAGAWVHMAISRRSNVLSLYVNGEFIDSQPSDATATNTNAPMAIGARPISTIYRPLNGSLALLRFSATAPSPEQIKKIYEDEKVLFQEGAQATLYGSSDAVTALAYDDSTNILSVGTSAGRSDFQGLRRVNNTTTAVTSAISASNGLIVEQ